MTGGLATHDPRVDPQAVPKSKVWVWRQTPRFNFWKMTQPRAEPVSKTVRT